MAQNGLMASNTLPGVAVEDDIWKDVMNWIIVYLLANDVILHKTNLSKTGL